MSEVINEALVNILIALISLGAAYAVYYINTLAHKVSEEAKDIGNSNVRKIIDDAIYRVSELAKETVTKFEQTIAADLREQVKAGKVDRNALLAVGQKAYDEVYNQLSDDVKNLLALEFNDVYALVVTLVEAEVYKLKRGL
jgi:pyrroline-5-carboxylate reductase